MKYHQQIYKQTYFKQNMEKDIGKIKKGEYQGTVTEIVIGIKEYNGKVGIDIREFATSEKYTGPTKKGLRIPAGNFQEFKKMINSIEDKDLEEPQATPDTQEGTNEPKASEEVLAPLEGEEAKPEAEQEANEEGLPDY
jgi:Transcriptional Coactivator p15 (PC4)